MVVSQIEQEGKALIFLHLNDHLEIKRSYPDKGNGHIEIIEQSTHLKNV